MSQFIRTHDVHISSVHAGKPLVLRPVSDADIPLLCQLNSDPRALEFSSDTIEPYDEKTVKGIWGYVSENALCFIVEYGGTPIGDLWLQRMNLPEVSALYSKGTDVRRIDMSIGRVDYWGHGIGTAMVRMLVDYAFQNTTTDVLHCMTSIRNVRSNRVWQKLGFILERSAPGTEYEQHYVLRRENYFKKVQ